LIRVVNSKICYGFENFLEFRYFGTGPFEFLQNYVDSDSLMFMRIMEVSFGFKPGFVRRFGLESSELLASIPFFLASSCLKSE